MGQGTDAIHTRTLTELARGLKEGEFSSRELTESLLKRIDEHQARLNAFITVTSDVALQRADAADKARANGDQGPLNGLPIVHKDLFCTRGVLTTCGSHILGNFVSPYDATVVERMAGWFVGWFRRRSCCQDRSCRDRNRYRRFNPPAGGAYRHGRPETYVWSGVPLWDGCIRVQP